MSSIPKNSDYLAYNDDENFRDDLDEDEEDPNDREEEHVADNNEPRHFKNDIRQSLK